MTAALVTQDEMCMRHIILSSVACLFLPNFFTLTQKRKLFRKELLNIKHVFSFRLQLFSKTYRILSRTERDMITNVYWSLCKVFVIVARFECNVNFLDRFPKNTQNTKFLENPFSGCWVVQCGRTDRRKNRHTDMSKLTVACRYFTKALQNAPLYGNYICSLSSALT